MARLSNLRTRLTARAAAPCYLGPPSAARTMIAAALAMAMAAMAAAQEGPPRSPTEIRGTLEIHGCKPDASTIDLRAHGISFGDSSTREDTVNARAPVFRALIERTRDPHTFTFAIRGLERVSPYDLTILLRPDPGCGKLFWRSPSHGVAVSGAPPILIEGVAATTSVELQELDGEDWVGADHLDFTDPVAASRRFRWRSTVPGAVGGELQISTNPFPIEGAFGPCDEPEGGVVYRQQLVAADVAWMEIDDVRFDRILAGVSPFEARLLLAGAPVYVRVVPITANGPACNRREQGVPGWVIVAKIPGGDPLIPEPPPVPPILEPGSGHQYRKPYFLRGGDGILHPTYMDFAYRAVKPHTLPTKAGCDWWASYQASLAGNVPLDQFPAFSDPSRAPSCSRTSCPRG
jgi:hypothetical protein